MSDLQARQVGIRDALIGALQADLVGPMLDDEVLSAAPSRWYLTGFLVPVGAPEDQRVDALADEAAGGEVETDVEDVADDVRVARPFLPSSIGMTIYLPEACTEVDVEVTWGDYEQLSEDDTREWVNKERALMARPPTEESESLRFRYWHRTGTFARTRTIDLDEPQTDIEEGGAYLRVVRRPIGDGSQAVSIFLVNGREPLPKSSSEADERSMFQVGLAVKSSQLLPRTRASAPHSLDDRRDDLQYRNHAEWAVGHGVATCAEEADGRCTRITTTWLPRASVYRMKATQVDGVLTGMEDLVAAEPAALRAGLEPLFEEYTDWIATRGDALAELVEARQRTGRELLAQASMALDRMRAGVELLCSDEDALRAFRIANAAMAASARKERPGAPHWRLFQLGFLLLNLVGVTHSDHVDRRRVELLFFPTGGGKTEAYLGVAAYALALRRVRHRQEPGGGAGVAIILRYTLRLLTLDQLRRAAQLICALELQRREAPHLLGDHRFSIGLWVGKSATANRMKDVVRTVRKAKEGMTWFGGDPAPTPLKSCPWCKTPLTAESLEIFPDARSPKALLVGCDDPECEFSFGYDRDVPEHQEGLPVVVVDEHIYRELPSIVVGTVDKFASLPWRGEMGMLFGRVAGMDAHGFRGPHEEKLGKEVQPLAKGLRPPELIIQDELHLISGPLGTMVGLYETAVEALCLERDAEPPKIIASTATARRSTEQIQAVFAREHTHLFPPQGIDAGDTFFATEDQSPATTRLYVGVAAPGRSAKVLAARSYTTLLGAAQKHWKDEAPGKNNPADTYMTLVAYFNALKELGGAQRLVQEDVATRTEQLDRRRPLNQEVSDHFLPRQLSYDLLELTSRQSTDAISSAIERLKQPVGNSFKTKMDVLLASSMISVGIDIERLGLMIVNGQPKTTAEYIQASSRVGRKPPGLVVTSLNLFKPRDRSHYERFQAYHESFYREVEATSVTPFSTRAIERGLSGLVVGLARHLGAQMAPNRQVERINRKSGAEVEERITDLILQRLRQHRPNVEPEVEDRLREHIEARFKNWRWVVEKANHDSDILRYSPWENPKKVTALLSTVVDTLVGELAEGLHHFRAPTSMRDVEPSVHVWVDLPQKEGRR